jgi:hypothetical protein
VDDEIASVLRQATKSVLVEPKKSDTRDAFLRVLNLTPLKDRVVHYATPDSLTRHFLRKHVNPPGRPKGLSANIYRMEKRQLKVNHVDLAIVIH